MLYRFTLHYSEALLKRAARSYWIRTTGVGFWVVNAMLTTGLAFGILSGDRTWHIGILGAVVFLCWTLGAAVYFVHLRNSLARFRAMGEPTAVIELGEADFKISSGLGSVTLAWAAITEVWRYESYWLLLFSKSQFSTLPLDTLPEEARAFLLHRVQAAGGKVTG